MYKFIIIIILNIITIVKQIFKIIDLKNKYLIIVGTFITLEIFSSFNVHISR